MVAGTLPSNLLELYLQVLQLFAVLSCISYDTITLHTKHFIFLKVYTQSAATPKHLANPHIYSPKREKKKEIRIPQRSLKVVVFEKQKLTNTSISVSSNPPSLLFFTTHSLPPAPHSNHIPPSASASPSAISCCKTIEYTLAFNSVNTVVVFLSNPLKESRISAEGFAARSLRTAAN